MKKELTNFLLREYGLLLDELFDSHESAWPDDVEMFNRVAKVKEELEHFENALNIEETDLIESQQANPHLSFFEVTEKLTVENDYRVLASDYEEAINVISCPKDHEGPIRDFITIGVRVMPISTKPKRDRG
tara:strand:+ start:379 stop:771 length:393 start_codon:yes stop_codon:yes gene_type:complete